MKVCVVLGAGASLANALHFRPSRQRQERPPLDTTFFETIDARKIVLPGPLRTYFTEVVGIDPTPTTLRERRMEEVFKDVYFDFLEAPDSQTMRNAYVALIRLYLRVLRETTNWLCADNRTGAPIGTLMAAAADVADEVTIITFNHDLVIENEIFRRQRLRRRWCLQEGYGSITLAPLAARGQRLLNSHTADCDHDRPITLLKLHGSLNWIVRMQSESPTANFLRGTRVRARSGWFRFAPLRGACSLAARGRGAEVAGIAGP